MSTLDFDILIIGGGIAGLATAAIAAAEGFSVALVEKTAPRVEDSDPAADLRTTAYLMPSIEALERAGVWQLIAPQATALKTMRIIDTGGKQGQTVAQAEFHAHEIGAESFGANLPNAPVRKALLEKLAALPNVRLFIPDELVSLLTRSAHVRASLKSGVKIKAALLIGADGRSSFVREHCGIAARRIDYGQQALVFVVSHDTAHNNVSAEIHARGGPFTLVPFTDDATGRPRSSVVWMVENAQATQLMALEPSAFTERMNARAGGLFGPLTLVSRIARWPMISLLAERYTHTRTALIAETAHVVPPIGAQGLNMSLRDAACLIELASKARAAGTDIGSAAVLESYARTRRPDAIGRIAATAALNTASIGALAPIRTLRAAGLQALGAASPIKKQIMQFGFGK
ncbi:MAG: FAD-dependent oxidoreductase [Neomegalonema sp.]|nr:FAD-dependent oxidoreductase [Neomegalonema sp.]